MRHSQRRRAALLRQEYLKGSDTESPRFRYMRLQFIEGVQQSTGMALLSLAIVGASIYEKNASYLAASGAMIAVGGVLRFRRGFMERIARESEVQEAILPDGTDDSGRIKAELDGLLSAAENVGLAFAVIGTLVNGFSGLIGDLWKG